VQLTAALAQIATLPSTHALRREQIELQVAVITPLLHAKGYAAPETRAAVEQAHLLIDRAQALGEPPEDSLLLAETTEQRWCEAELHRTAGEIAVMSPQPDAAKAEACFERALSVARGQQTKSWGLRAATSMARLWRDQGKRQQARDLLGPVYGWFTEGFDALDLKEAKTLLEQLSA